MKDVMKTELSKKILLAISVSLIVLSISRQFSNKRVGDILEYSGLLILLIGIFTNLNIRKNKKDIQLLFVVLFVFSFGLLLQDMDMMKKIRLILSMIILSSIAIMPSSLIYSPNALRIISNSIMFSLLIACFISSITGMSIITEASEGILIKYGFDGGLEHRNYFSYTVFSAFICDYLFIRITKSFRRNYMLFIEVLLLLISNSRSALLLLIVFLLFCGLSIIRTNKNYRVFIVFFIIIIGIVLGVPVYRALAVISENFFFRTNGLNNYLSMFKGDMFHMLFGNAAMAFKDSGFDYDYNIRSVIGWNGSTELVILNVLIKNGVIGFIGYFLIFRHSLKKILISRNNFYTFFAVWLTFLISAFVESYVANINYIYTIVIYMILANVKEMESKRNRSQKKNENNCILSPSIPYNPGE